jgi:hypothetical protein
MLTYFAHGSLTRAIIKATARDTIPATPTKAGSTIIWPLLQIGLDHQFIRCRLHILCDRLHFHTTSTSTSTSTSACDRYTLSLSRIVLGYIGLIDGLRSETPVLFPEITSAVFEFETTLESAVELLELVQHMIWTVKFDDFELELKGGG